VRFSPFPNSFVLGIAGLASEGQVGSEQALLYIKRIKRKKTEGTQGTKKNPGLITKPGFFLTYESTKLPV